MNTLNAAKRITSKPKARPVLSDEEMAILDWETEDKLIIPS